MIKKVDSFSSPSVHKKQRSAYAHRTASCFLPIIYSISRNILSNIAPRRRGLVALSSAFFLSSQRTASFSTSTSTTTCAAMNLRVVPNSKLFVSEPDPSWFGNGPNEDLAKNSHWTNANWLKSRFHFSFAEYNNPANSQFGVLRVMNDDLVQPARGFGAHPHRNMEIITYIVHGELTHKDSMGSYETLGRGSIQFMTAGKGVSHSEQNKSPTKPLRFIQTWIMPSQGNLTPNYGSAPGILQPNQLKHLVSSADDDDDTATKAPVQIHQDVNAHAAELELNQRVTMDIPKGRQAYLLCIEGSLSLNQGQAQLQKHDACEITGNGASLEIEATQVEETEHGQLAHFLVFTMKEQAGSGRRDL